MSTPGAAICTRSTSGNARTAMIESSARITKRRLRFTGSDDIEGRSILSASPNTTWVGPRRLLASSVGTSSRPARTNNGSSSTLRSRPRERDTAGGERCSRAAAPTTEPVSSKASRTRRRLRSTLDEFIRSMVPHLFGSSCASIRRLSPYESDEGPPMNPYMWEKNYGSNHRYHAMSERKTVTRPPPHKPRRDCQSHRDGSRLVHHSP